MYFEDINVPKHTAPGFEHTFASTTLGGPNPLQDIANYFYEVNCHFTGSVGYSICLHLRMFEYISHPKL